MAPAVKRRKVSATTSSSTKSRGLDSFTSVSKTSTTTATDRDDRITQLGEIVNGKKRKLGEEEVSISSIEIDRDIKPLLARRSSQRVPQTPKKPIQIASSLIETPTKGASTLLDRLVLSSKTPTRSALGFHSSSSSITQSTPHRTKTVQSEGLPIELLDLVNLHAAFLTAISLHYAHNGTASPADLRLLCPDVARSWGKRKVTLDDIQRTLGVQNENMLDKDGRFSRLSLSDYGHGKICVEMRTIGGNGNSVRPVNEDFMNDLFVKQLVARWECKGGVAFPEFLESLPLEVITTCSSLLKMSPLLAKGQRRLEDLKSGVTKKEVAKQKTPIETNGAKPTLLERLRAKQLHQLTLPSAPSKADLSRKAALHRIEEVAAVLSILSTSSSVGQQRISFTMPTVLGKLKDSFKTPISKEEGDNCIRLLAAEIAPEWVRLLKMGKVEAVVVNRDERPGEVEIRERVMRIV